LVAATAKLGAGNDLLQVTADWTGTAMDSPATLGLEKLKPGGTLKV